MKQGNRPMLEGIRVADMSTAIFGPYCTQILADMGADVIKIEHGDGDSTRNIGSVAKTPGMGGLHMTINRGKRSVVWDLRSEAGREAMHRLLKSSDIFIHNVRADGIARLGLDYESVREICPDIIYVHCVGFGSSGPYASRQAYDDLIQAAAGMVSLLPKVDGNPNPRYLPMAIADKVSGLHAVYATLAALTHKLRTGEGQHVEVPMMETLTSFTLLEHLAERTFIPPIGGMLYPRQIHPKRQPARTRDGYISIAPYQDHRWIAYFNAVGRSEVLEDPRLNTKALRYENIGLMYDLVAEISPERTTEEWLALLHKAGVPAMRVNDVEDLLDDPHLQAVGHFQERDHPSEGKYVEVQPAVKFSAMPNPKLGPAPRFGQHTDSVLNELGLGDR
jgi:crotonobetainyl-CoA:carnitine CoA-transferase CaiB-like acyl-CoA transferase